MGRIVFAKFVPGTDAKEPDMRADWFIVEEDGSSQHKLASLSGGVGWVAAPPVGQRILLIQPHSGDRRLLEINADGTGLREIRKLTDGSPPDGLPMQTLCTNPVMLHGRISGCFPCRRGFFAARGNRFDSQMDRSRTPFHTRAVMGSRFLSSARSSAVNWFGTT